MDKLQIFDRVKSTATAASATGNVSMDSSVQGFLQPADTAVAQGQWWPMLIEDEATGDWEVGFYQEQNNFNTEFGRSGNQVVLASSNAGSAVSFSTASEALTVSVIDPAEFVGNPQQYVSVSAGDIVQRGTLSYPNGNNSRFPLVSSAYVGFVEGQAADIENGASEGHAETVVAGLATTDATATPVFVFEIPSSACIAFVEGVALMQDDSGNSRVQTFKGCAHYDGSTAELLGTPTVDEEANDGSVTAAISVDYSSGLRVVATGEAATDFSWMVKATVTYLEY